jgi:general secretion pathway protein G
MIPTMTTTATTTMPTPATGGSPRRVPAPRTRPAHPLVRVRRAFSLIEVIVAVTIVAIMAAIFVPRLTRFIGSAKDKRARTESSSLAQQVRLYMTENGFSRLPSDFDLEILAEGENPYLPNRSALNDPWGNAYVIVVPGRVNFDFDIVSYGADGAPGGEGEAKDITNGEE